MGCAWHLANRLNQESELEVLEASGGETLASRERLKGRLNSVGRAVGSPVGARRRWIIRVRRELAALSSALEEHIDETERQDGVFSEILMVAPSCPRRLVAAFAGFVAPITARQCATAFSRSMTTT